jgi:hypothetical protein
VSAQEVQLERVVHRLDRSGHGLALDGYLAPPPGGFVACPQLGSVGSGTSAARLK